MRPVKFSAIFLFSVFLYLHVHASEEEKQLSKDEIAYANYKPYNYFSRFDYEVEIYTDVETYRFNYWGSILITMKCITKNNKIFLDRNDINIDERSIKAWKCIRGEKDEPITVHYGRYVSESEGYKIKLEEYMQVGITYKVRLNFSNILYSRYHGLIVNSYQQKTNHPYAGDNPERWIQKLTEFDRSRLESKFGETENEEISNGLPKIWVMDEFVKTDLVSPFSLALAVVDYGSLEPAYQFVGPPYTDFSKVEIRIWAEQDILNHTREILRVAEKSLAYFAQFFDVSYNLGKLDLIVLPDEDVTVENYYGLIYLGEKTVKNVFNEPNHYRPDRYLLASKICQAISRQWIGHFVTLSMLNESWFYDGLHTYLQRHCVLNAFKNWNVDVHLDIIDSFITLLKTEERGRDYNPIVELGSGNNFIVDPNSETKLKIHLVIRLLSFILEAEKKLFQKSLSEYIKKFESTVPTLKQVWSSLTTTANKVQGIQILPQGSTFEKIIFSWLGRRGYPLINVFRDNATKVMILTQEEFTFPGQHDSGRCWSIPFDIVTKNQMMSDSRKVRIWLTCSTPHLHVALTAGEETEWVVISLELHVPGRVYYDLESRTLIQKLFHNKKEISSIDILTRIHLIHDMFTLAEASKYSYDFVFETMKYVSHEENYKCWHVILQELRRVRSRWSGTSLFDPLQKFVLTIVQPIFEERIKNIDTFLRSERSSYKLEKLIIETVCTFEHADCKEYSENLLDNLRTHDNYEAIHPISETLREIFYCLAMKNAKEITWNFLLNKYDEDPSDLRILRALGCSRNKKILKKFLNWCMDKENRNRSPTLCLHVFEILSSSYDGYQLITPFFSTSRLSLNKKFEVLNSFIKSFLTDLTIDDFLLKAIENTRIRKDLDKLSKFSNKLQNRKKENVTRQNEITSIVSRHISWYEETAEKLLNYFSTSSSTLADIDNNIKLIN